MDIVSGMWEVRPPNLNFIKKKDTDNYTEYLVKTNNINNNRNEDDPNYLTNYLNSFIYCSPEFTIKIPKKEYMIKKDGTKRFAYAVGMFPAPKTKKASYLDGCILAALGLKRQGTNADIICFITHSSSLLILICIISVGSKGKSGLKSSSPIGGNNNSCASI